MPETIMTLVRWPETDNYTVIAGTSWKLAVSNFELVSGDIILEATYSQLVEFAARILFVKGESDNHGPTT